MQLLVKYKIINNDGVQKDDHLNPPVFILFGSALNLSQVVCPIFLLNSCYALLISYCFIVIMSNYFCLFSYILASCTLFFTILSCF
jgi:hypothetical protein